MSTQNSLSTVARRRQQRQSPAAANKTDGDSGDASTEADTARRAIGDKGNAAAAASAANDAATGRFEQQRRRGVPADLSDYDRFDDATLMARCRDGDEAAFHAVYDRYRDWVVRQARRYVKQDADSLDIMQEVFRYLFSIVPTYRPAALLTTLLYKVVRNTCLSELQRQRRGGGQISLDEDEARDLAVAPEVKGQDCPLETDQVTTAIHALPEIYREVILLRLVEEWPYQEISEALELPLGTVKSRLHYGLDILRQKLARFVRV